LIAEGTKTLEGMHRKEALWLDTMPGRALAEKRRFYLDREIDHQEQRLDQLSFRIQARYMIQNIDAAELEHNEAESAVMTEFTLMPPGFNVAFFNHGQHVDWEGSDGGSIKDSGYSSEADSEVTEVDEMNHEELTILEEELKTMTASLESLHRQQAIYARWEATSCIEFTKRLEKYHDSVTHEQ